MVPPYQDFDPDSLAGRGTVASMRWGALASLLENAYEEGEARNPNSDGARPRRIATAAPDEARRRRLFAALEPFLFAGRPPDRFRTAGASDTARFAAWLADGAFGRAERKGAPPRGWGETRASELPSEMAHRLDSLRPGSCLGPVAAAFGAWAACRPSEGGIPATDFDVASPFLGALLREGTPIPAFDEAAITAYLKAHPGIAMAPDTVRYRVWLEPRGRFPGDPFRKPGGDTVGLTGRDAAEVDLPPSLARRLDTLRRAGAFLEGRVLDMGEWPLGRWRVGLWGDSKGRGQAPPRVVRERAMAGLRAPWIQAWEAELAARAEAGREAARDGLRSRSGYSLDSVAAQARRWMAADVWIDSARIRPE